MVGRQFAEVVVLNVDWPFDKPLDSTQMRALGGVAERIGHAFRAGSGRPSNPVDIAFRFVWQLEIDDMGDTVDVDAARGDVGRDKNPQLVGFKSVQGPLTGCLAICCREWPRPRYRLGPVALSPGSPGAWSA